MFKLKPGETLKQVYKVDPAPHIVNFIKEPNLCTILEEKKSVNVIDLKK